MKTTDLFLICNPQALSHMKTINSFYPWKINFLFSNHIWINRWMVSQSICNMSWVQMTCRKKAGKVHDRTAIKYFPHSCGFFVNHWVIRRFVILDLQIFLVQGFLTLFLLVNISFRAAMWHELMTTLTRDLSQTVATLCAYLCRTSTPCLIRAGPLLTASISYCTRNGLTLSKP